MGCLKLIYYQPEPQLKVVQGKPEPQQKLVQSWLSVDPLADDYPSLSPYCYAGNNPVLFVDPNGMSISEFDENGNYIRTTKDNWWHNLWHGRKGQIIGDNGDVTQEFKFADPKNDVQALKDGVIDKVQIVEKNEIIYMLSYSGVFDEGNKVDKLNNRYDYMLEEAVGGGLLDFSITGIPYEYPEASKSPQTDPSTMMFLVDGVAHNHMNYGNFLYGAAGKALGLTKPELLGGAHFNRIANPGMNNYKPQFDRRDDQFSIKMGIRHGRKNNYKNMYYRVTVGNIYD